MREPDQYSFIRFEFPISHVLTLTYAFVCANIYIYIYIHTERERDRDRQTDRNDKFAKSDKI